MFIYGPKSDLKMIYCKSSLFKSRLFLLKKTWSMQDQFRSFIDIIKIRFWAEMFVSIIFTYIYHVDYSNDPTSLVYNIQLGVESWFLPHLWSWSCKSL